MLILSKMQSECVWGWVGGCVCVCAYMEAKEQHRCFTCSLSVIFIERWCVTELGTQQSDKLDDWPASTNIPPHLHLPSARIIGKDCYTFTFVWIHGIWAQILILSRQEACQLSLSHFTPPPPIRHAVAIALTLRREILGLERWLCS